MMIPFTQYMLPNGRKVLVEFECDDPEVKALADRFIRNGGWFECEYLSVGNMVSLTACAVDDDCDLEPNDIAIEVVSNGPAVVSAVSRLVRKAVAWQEQHA